MKISELIDRLELLRSIHGDLAVVDREGCDLHKAVTVDECMQEKAKSREPVAFVQVQ